MSDLENELIGLGLGAVDYIFKPIIPELVQLRFKIHLELKTQRDLLRKLSLQDELTELPNRRALEECLLREWTRSRKQNSPLALILIGIDHVKAYNESCGRAAGDAVLKQVAHIIDEKIKQPLDFTARYGGAEFACILPGGESTEAKSIAEDIRAAVEAAGIEHPSSPTAPILTVCAGVAGTRTDQSATAESLFSLTDSQLCLAIQQGGNRVLSFSGQK